MRWLFALSLIAACGDDGGSNTPIDGPPSDMSFDAADAPIDADPNRPPTLMDTGLCLNAACTQINPDAKPFTPQYTLWSDGSTKKRWIYLPPGTKIDTTDMNFWKFPVGTKVWKEFTSGGTRVETRLMMKIMADDTMPGAWFFASYVWNASQDATTEATPAGIMNANGTQHDIPSRSQCRRCHENTPGRVLGVQAMSLDFDGAAGELDLDGLVAGSLLTTNPPAAGSLGAPRFPLPGTTVDKTAFGYVHANCGGCHNPESSVAATTPLDLRLDTTKLATVAMVPAHATTVNVNGTVGGLLGPIVKPGDPAGSVIIVRTNLDVGVVGRMPELGNEIVDPAGQAALTAWINQPP